jgi:hypothetical protein
MSGNEGNIYKGGKVSLHKIRQSETDNGRKVRRTVGKVLKGRIRKEGEVRQDKIGTLR